jgi:hypothetical protein
MIKSLPMKIPREGSENHQKRETGGATRTLEESRQTFYIVDGEFPST